MFNGIGYYRQPSNDEQEVTWIDNLIEVNPQGVMEVLARNGYSGHLAPKDSGELTDAAYHFVEVKGSRAVTELLKAHPLYEAFCEVYSEERKIRFNFLNADGEGSSVMSSIMTMDHKKVIMTLLMVLGAYFVASKVWDIIRK